MEASAAAVSDGNKGLIMMQQATTSPPLRATVAGWGLGFFSLFLHMVSLKYQLRREGGVLKSKPYTNEDN